MTTKRPVPYSLGLRRSDAEKKIRTVDPQTVRLWEIMLGTGQTWVLFESGSVVVIPGNEQNVDVVANRAISALSEVEDQRPQSKAARWGDNWIVGPISGRSTVGPTVFVSVSARTHSAVNSAAAQAQNIVREDRDTCVIVYIGMQ